MHGKRYFSKNILAGHYEFGQVSFHALHALINNCKKLIDLGNNWQKCVVSCRVSI